MRIPDDVNNIFDKKSEGMEWGEVVVKAIFQDKKPVFFVDTHDSEKYVPTDGASVPANSRVIEENRSHGRRG